MCVGNNDPNATRVCVTRALALSRMEPVYVKMIEYSTDKRLKYTIQQRSHLAVLNAISPYGCHARAAVSSDGFPFFPSSFPSHSMKPLFLAISDDFRKFQNRYWQSMPLSALVYSPVTPRGSVEGRFAAVILID